MIGNNDSHAKNLSLLYTEAGPRLAPFYDLMSTTLYRGLSRHFAFQVNGENRPGNIEASHLESLARSMRFHPRYFIKQGTGLAERMLATLDDTHADLETIALPGTEQTLLERLHQRIASNCRRLPAHWSTG
ncbi:HipA domain-containing protein [Halomonas caseinilytica]|uniref:HipA domain-containing protein n=1 Tax=Halomonas caseinilytica TaxID=438744 RepID=UPI0008492B31|nr:HipA domain-containing protein [Halomonas caseinilytica]